ncbi:MAG: hypothetical protein ABIH20_06225 [Candidatus Diapherotrites archaeon]
MNKETIIVLILAMGLLAMPFAIADSGHDFSEAEAIVSQKTPCESLSQEQLASVGDYYMEQIHPGEQHESMDAMMGGEGSESLKQMHIAMTYRFYCSGLSDEANQYYGMMGSGYSNYGMMGSGMMGGMMDGTYGPGMMYNNYGSNPIAGTIGTANSVLFALALVVVIIFFGIKISKEIKGGKK